MSIVARLEHFSLADLIQTLAASKKTGRLGLTRRDAQGAILFREGKIIYAGSSTARETLGHLLLCCGLIQRGHLTEALALQTRGGRDQRLGEILIAMGAVSEKALEEVLKGQIGRVVSELLTWDSGFLRFDGMDIPDWDGIEVEAEEFLLRDGIVAEVVLSGGRVGARPDLEALARLEEDGGEEDFPAPASVRKVMSELRAPVLTAEVTLRVLDCAQHIVKRGALFAARDDAFRGVGQFGVNESKESSQPRVGEIIVPANVESVLRDTADRKEAYCSALSEGEWNAKLVEGLGGVWPAQVLVMPLIVRDRCVLLFYGDNAPDTEPIGSTAPLEVLLLEVGLSMERQLLERRAAQLRTAGAG